MTEHETCPDCQGKGTYIDQDCQCEPGFMGWCTYGMEIFCHCEAGRRLDRQQMEEENRRAEQKGR